MDSERDEDEADASVKAVVFASPRKNVLGEILQCFGPSHPLWFVLGIGGEEKTGEDEERREDSRRPFTCVAPGLVGWVLGEIGEEDTEETEHAESCCQESISN